MKNKRAIVYLSTTALFAAMITVLTAYIGHIPFGANSGYIHFGDAFIYLAACLLPAPYKIIAAALGAGLADLLTAPVWFIPTIIIKSLITISFTSKGDKIISVRNIVAPSIGVVITIVGYYLAEVFLFGFNWLAPLAGIPGSIIQGVGSALIFVAIGLALDKAGFKKKIIGRL